MAWNRLETCFLALRTNTLYTYILFKIVQLLVISKGIKSTLLPQNVNKTDNKG